MRPRHRALSYANVAATLALLLGFSGGALAANHYLINSTSQINPRVLKHLRGATGATGPQGLPGAPGAQGRTGPEGIPGQTGKPGPVGPEGKRGTEGRRGREGAEGKEGPPGQEGGSGGEPAALKRWRRTVKTAGLTKASATTVTLLEAPPFTIIGHCYEEGAETLAQTYIASTQLESYLRLFEVEAGVRFGIERPLTPEPAQSETATHEAALAGGPDGSFAATSREGTVALDGVAGEGVWLQGENGPACSFSGYAVVE